MEMPQELEEKIEATHSDLSGAARRFLDYARAEPECLRPLDRQSYDLPDWVLDRPLQSWPLFVDQRKLEEIRRGAEGVTRLIKAIPERIFEGDFKRIAEFYGAGNEHFLAMLFRPPNGIEGAFVRGDFADSFDGFKCLEINLGVRLAGWQSHFVEKIYRSRPVIARFLEREGIEPRFQDPFRSFLGHVVEQTLEKPTAGDGVLNVALVASEIERMGGAEAQAYLNGFYASLLRERGDGLEGQLLLGSYPGGFAVKRGRLHLGDTPVHAVIEYTLEPTPQEVFRCFKGNTICLYNGPLAAILNDKRNLALLSMYADSGVFDEDEKAIVREHVPWTRELAPTETTFRGERVRMPDLLLARREEMVIKVTFGSHGQDVFVGLHTDPGTWADVVRKALAEPGKWLAQEYVPSRPYLLQHGEEGCAPHEVAWGIFCFGSSYGGIYLRMAPRGRTKGVLNVPRGADEGFCFEV